jgi:hypothetical protein
MSEEVEDAQIELSKETVKCFTCKHFKEDNPGKLGYTFPCKGAIIAEHGPLPVRYLCNGEPSNPNWPILPAMNANGETLPDVIECRNYENIASDEEE